MISKNNAVKKTEENFEGNENGGVINNFNTNSSSQAEDIIERLILSHRIISKSSVQKAGHLILEEDEGHMFSGEKVQIFADGVKGGRGAGDGVVLFCKKKKKEGKSDNFCLKDSVYRADRELVVEEEIEYPYVFAVFYDVKRNKFNIKAYNGKYSDNRILFIKLTASLRIPILKKEVIAAGRFIFQISVPDTDPRSLEIAHLSKETAHAFTRKTFRPPQKTVTIGRQKTCDFSFPKDRAFSRLHTTFEFSEEKGLWFMRDGFGERGSTNGTWLFGTHPFEIEEDLTVEILTSKVRIKVVKG